MKHLLIAILLLACQRVSSQDAKIDSLIHQMSNTDIHGECNYNWVVKFNSKAGNELERIGRPATEKLLTALTDSARGIAAHYVLTRIYKPDARIAHLLALAEKDNLIVYKYNGLLFFESQHGTYTSKDAMRTNLSEWKSFLNNR
jgi:hypothetical protein